MSAVGSRHNKVTVEGTKKSRKPAKGSKAARAKSPSPVSKVVRDCDSVPEVENLARSHRKSFRTPKSGAALLEKTSTALGESGHQEADRAVRALEAALEKGADRRAVDGLAKALVARACSADAVELVIELASLLCETGESSFLLGLAKDLENGADPDLVGSLASYLQSGVSPAKIGALAWFFPREQLIRPRRVLTPSAA